MRPAAFTCSNNCMIDPFHKLLSSLTSAHYTLAYQAVVEQTSWSRRRGAPEQGSPPKAGFPASLIIMELGRFLSALISGTVRRVRRKRGPNVKALSGGCLRLGFPAKCAK